MQLNVLKISFKQSSVLLANDSVVTRKINEKILKTLYYYVQIKYNSEQNSLAACSLFVDIVHILEQNIHFFCKQNKNLFLFCLQDEFASLDSQLLIQLNRTSNQGNSTQHFCLLSQAFIEAAYRSDTTFHRNVPRREIFIGFSVGQIMGGDWCEALLFNDIANRKDFYSELDSEHLNQFWKRHN